MFEAPRDIPWIEQLVAKLAPSPITDAALESLAAYVALVASWDRHHNLTGASDVKQLIEILLADAMVLTSPELIPEGARSIDVGAGAGAPSIPLSLLRDDVHALLVEPRKKRAAFMRYAIGSLNLQDRVSIKEQRLDMDHPKALTAGQSFDVALSRATFSPEVWQGIGLVLAPKCVVLGTEALQQLSPLAPARLLRQRSYAWPFSNAPRTLQLLGKSV